VTNTVTGLGGRRWFGRLCSKIRPLCYAPMLPTTSHYDLSWVLLYSINKLLCGIEVYTKLPRDIWVHNTVSVLDTVCFLWFYHKLLSQYNYRCPQCVSTSNWASMLLNKAIMLNCAHIYLVTIKLKIMLA